MEETKELQTAYKIFRAVIYLSLVIEFFEYAIRPELLDYWGGILCDIHDRIKRWFIYNDGNLIWSKVATILVICVTCIGTRNKKHLEFDARKQVFYPLVCGIFITVLSVWLYGHRIDSRFYSLPLNIWFYMVASIIGTILIHVALDNISKFLKEGLLKEDTLSMIMAVPDKGLAAKRQEAETERLKKARASWGEEVKDLIEKNRILDEWQAAEDTPEQKATLPKLLLKDVERDPKPSEPEERELRGVPVLLYPKSDNGVV